MKDSMTNNINKYEVGEFVSVWRRESKRHKWRIEYGYVLLTNIDVDNARISCQTNETHSGAGWIVMRLHGEGKWERKLEDPIFDAKINIEKIKDINKMKNEQLIKLIRPMFCSSIMYGYVTEEQVEKMLKEIHFKFL